MTEIEKAESLVGNRGAFNKQVYCTTREALDELEKRQGNTAIDDYLAKVTPSGIPEILKGKKSLVLFRHIATPNYEIRRFFIVADALDHLQPVLLEYLDDKFTNRNEWKFSLGKVPFYRGENSKGESMIEYQNIIDINSSNNKPISSVRTVWDQPLADFHHELFLEAFPNSFGSVFDLSKWLHQNGSGARDYYKAFLSLFLKHGILLENFLLDGTEAQFIKEIIVPTLLEIERETGLRPLIMALEPTEIESSKFWLSHPIKHKPSVAGRIAKKNETKA